MGYAGIVRKCSVCQRCGMCDYEHEAETGEFSGDFSPVPHSFMFRKENATSGTAIPSAADQ